MRSSFRWGVTQRRFLISYRRFGTTYRYHFQESSSPRIIPGALLASAMFSEKQSVPTPYPIYLCPHHSLYICAHTIPYISVPTPYPIYLCPHHSLYICAHTIPYISVPTPFPIYLCPHHSLYICAHTIPYISVPTPFPIYLCPHHIIN
jgi:hypothetical protein